MKSILEQLECLGYVLPQDINVGLILIGLSNDFARFVRNYNMHNMGRRIGELHAMLIEYEKGLPKKAAKPQVLAIQCGKIQKPNKKPQAAKGKGKGKGKDKSKLAYAPNPKIPLPAKKSTRQRTRLTTTAKRWERKLKHGALYVYMGNGLRVAVEAIGSFDLDYDLESSTHILIMVLTKKVDKTPYELWYGKVPNLSYLKDTQRKQRVTTFTSHLKTKFVVSRYDEFFEKNLITQKASKKVVELKEIHEEDTSPYKNISEYHVEGESLKPQINVAPVPRSERIYRAPDQLCLNVEVEEHSLRDLNEPANYKATVLDIKYEKWLDAMNEEMRSIKIIKSTKGYTQTYGIDYEETSSYVADIRAIRILIAIAVFYDYEIWKMDVKTTFMNGYLYEDVYMASGSNVTFLILYVDDILIMGNYIPMLQDVNSYIGKCFAMKDLMEAAYILGIKIYRDRSRRLTELSQTAYIDKILKRYRIDKSKRGNILMQERFDLNNTQGASTPEASGAYEKGSL
ncbi:retrotransposon protein, putative, ty1-copia subclass [Tanacetum coccineum]